ncbi:hypothetical protein C2857_003579 [Epichloe festucae Fl1]|uniref:Intramembrane protease n=1 Tax=Epichloe festucae (strain Fl1) TaxID=877507 RepID=A0A7S9KNY2_EPIFF|nr:hypothetical protein C2857_003579 [Epichloe festucae Fl1]
MASNTTLQPDALDTFDTLNTTFNGTQQHASALSYLQDLDFMLLEFKLVVSALGIIYLGSHAAIRRPPSAAPPRDKKDREKDDSDRFSQGLEPSDAIVFPIMAAVTLIGLYYLIQWLKDPAVLNKILRYYMTTMSMASVLTLYAHGMDLGTSFLFPTYWRGRDGSLRKADQKNKVVALCDDAGNVVGEAPSANPLPGPFGFLAPTNRMRRAAWELRGVFTRRWQVDLFARGMGEVKTHLRFSHVMALLLSVGTALVYFSTTWSFLSNMLGYGMCYGSFLIFSPTDFMTGSLVLWGLFFYDIFMVFYTPYMITVATALDVPIKLTFEAASRKSILGLGDIVIPGMIIGWTLRLDLWLHYVRKIKYESTDLVLVEKDATSGEIRKRSETKHKEVKAPYVEVKGNWGDGFWSRGSLFPSRPHQLPPHLAGARFAKVYFHAAMVGYTLGMGVTLAMLLVFKRGQPALLYLVPGVLGALVATALARGEFGDMWRYTEDGSLDTMHVVVDLDSDGNAIRRIGALEDGVVDTTKDEKKDKGEGGKDQKSDDEAVLVKKAEDDKSRRRKVFVLSVEAAEK